MSALGHKRTCAVQKGMSALPPIATAKADIALSADLWLITISKARPSGRSRFALATNSRGAPRPIEQPITPTYDSRIGGQTMIRLLFVIALLCIASVAQAQKTAPENKPVMTTDQCSRACTKLCVAGDPLCIVKCQTRCTQNRAPKR
jgi:hypothetical protein